MLHSAVVTGDTASPSYTNLFGFLAMWNLSGFIPVSYLIDCAFLTFPGLLLIFLDSIQESPLLEAFSNSQHLS